MVNPINPVYLIIIPLAVGFTLYLFDKLSKKLSGFIFFASLFFSFSLSLHWLISYGMNPSADSFEIITGGIKAPYSINLFVGFREAFFLLLTNFFGFLGSIYLFRQFPKPRLKIMIVYLIFIMSLNGMIMTNDIFNLFVFIEISSIGTYVLAGLTKDKKALEAGFKTIVIGSISSMFILLGAVLLYKLSGSLNMTDIALYASANLNNKYLIIAGFIFLAGLILELKIFPVNGWAVDLYEGINPGTAAVIAAASVKVFYLVFGKLFFILYTVRWEIIIISVGVTTFLISNVFALVQNKAKRILGYSSIGQIGLLLTALPFYQMPGISDTVKISVLLFILNHSFAKAGLFWIAGIVNKEKIQDWKGALDHIPLYKGIFMVFILSLTAMPPFPGFFAKIYLLMSIIKTKYALIIIPLLLGSLAEIAYYFKWWKYVYSSADEPVLKLEKTDKLFPVTVLFLVLISIAGYTMNFAFPDFYKPIIYAFLAGVFIFIAGQISERVQGIASLLVTGFLCYVSYTMFEGLFRVFSMMFASGGFLVSIVSFSNTERKKDTLYYPFLYMLVISLLGITALFQTKIEFGWILFFFLWELMTLSSYFLIGNRDENSEKASIRYILLNSLGAFIMLAGILMLYNVQGDFYIKDFSHLTGISAVTAVILLFIGAGFKMAVFGFHIWAPGAYTYSKERFTPFFSGAMSKIGVLFVIVLFMLGGNLLLKWKINHIIGWFGAATAFVMTLLAVFQEDIKKLLAYSSIGQLGYILIGAALMTPLGWTSAVYHSFNHFLFKTLLFIAVGGVIYMTGERHTYRLGGLIKKMPVSYISVLIGIIVLAGVPPLSGIGSKRLLYTALLQKEWYFMLALMMFSSVTAFLYLFKLIHTVFLGQLKRRFKDVKEAPLSFTIPQVILWIAIMVFSTVPKYFLEPVNKLIGNYFAEEPLTFEGFKSMESGLGYWNAYSIMMLVMGVFFAGLIILLITKPKYLKKVGQLDIGFAGEVPTDPDEIHYAKHFYNYYRKVFGGMFKFSVTRLYEIIGENIIGFAHTARKIFYCGSIQIYVYFVLITFVLAALMI